MCRIWLSCIVRDGTGVMRGVARITDDREGGNGRDEQMI